MSDPPRLRERGAEAPTELAELFQGAKKPEPLTPATDARLLGQITALGAAPTATLGKGWLIAGAAMVVASAAAVVAQRGVKPSATPSPSTTHSASASAPPSASTSIDAVPTAAAELQAPLESKRAPGARMGQGAPAEVASSREDALAGEAKLLNQAHAAMATDPRTAYAFASEHAKQYPRGQLAAERELILVQALVKLGRVHEAEARGRALRKSAPSSIYGERLDTILKGK